MCYERSYKARSDFWFMYNPLFYLSLSVSLCSVFKRYAQAQSGLTTGLSWFPSLPQPIPITLFF
jgi:hypothetical protein